jgi:hypothetical protein
MTYEEGLCEIRLKLVENSDNSQASQHGYIPVFKMPKSHIEIYSSFGKFSIKSCLIRQILRAIKFI